MAFDEARGKSTIRIFNPTSTSKTMGSMVPTLDPSRRTQQRFVSPSAECLSAKPGQQHQPPVTSPSDGWRCSPRFAQPATNRCCQSQHQPGTACFEFLGQPVKANVLSFQIGNDFDEVGNERRRRSRHHQSEVPSGNARTLADQLTCRWRCPLKLNRTPF